MNNYTKKVACMVIPLFYLNLTIAAESNTSDLNSWKIAAVEEAASVNQNTHKVTGIVKSENGDPVIGASVVEVGTTNGIMTNMDGEFELSIKANGSLQISYIGFVTQTIKPGNKNNIQIILQEDNQTLDEVVVVAFGKSTKEAFTGSAGVIKSDDLLKAQVSNPASALAGYRFTEWLPSGI